MVKKIGLTQGKYALVDDEDFEKLNQYNWHANRCSSKNWYATRMWKERDDKPTTESMHRQIMGAPDNMQVDHINHNGLDNRKCNLRLCTRSQNAYNRKPRPDCSSQYKGVSFHKRYKKWEAYIRVKGKLNHLGSFDDEIDAAQAYNEAAREHFGEFAYLNDV